MWFMNSRDVLPKLASAVTTFLLVGAATIEILSTWYGESLGIGILAGGVGVITPLFVGAVVTFTAGRLSGLRAAALVAVGAFGVAFLAIAGLSYVNVPGADEVFTFPRSSHGLSRGRDRGHRTRQPWTCASDQDKSMRASELTRTGSLRSGPSVPATRE